MKNNKLVFALLLFVGCPSSNFYRPLPAWESKFFAVARRDIFPKDVRKTPDKFQQTLIVWSGVIKEIKFTVKESHRIAVFVVEHHYFDWIEDHGVQSERFFLSPRGEGLFEVAWGVEAPSAQTFVKQFEVGDMMVVYGYPQIVRDALLVLYPAQNLRGIKPQWYRTDVLDYGRPGEPVRHLKRGVF